MESIASCVRTNFERASMLGPRSSSTLDCPRTVRLLTALWHSWVWGDGLAMNIMPEISKILVFYNNVSVLLADRL